jgi:uncharacterized phage protein gp47/JayE
VPYARPTLGDLWNRIGALWRATYPGADTNLRNSPDRAVIGVIARSTDEDLSFTDWLALQVFPFSAQADYLERWAAWKNVQRKAATPGFGTIVFTGATPNSVAIAGTQMQSATGVVVSFNSDCVVANDGTATALAQAVIAVGSTSGAVTNLGIGGAMAFVGTPAGFPDSGTVGSTFAGGADAEIDSALRLRTERRYSQPSFGGNQNDWQNAALAVSGVTRIFTSPASPTPGAVTLWPLFDDIRANGVPIGTDAYYRPGTGPSAGTAGGGDQRAVLDAVLPSRPVGAHVYVKAAAVQVLNITLTGLAALSNAVKAAIATELANMLVAKLGQIDAQLGNVGALSNGYTIYTAWISAAVSQAAGVRNFDLTLPSADVIVPRGTILVLGAITYA